ncbi:MAG: DUF4255 domain-containing protein [Anaerolineae bacterium]|nr:DUF4255 domain-containing protein [Anaerolineae bacterium]
MFQDLDDTLAALLQRELPLNNVAISFAAPDNTFPPIEVTPPAVDFFLYDIRENLNLRSNEWTDVRQPNGNVSRQRPSTRVDCSYLITAWSSAANAVRDEHRLLGEVMRVLLRYRRLPADILQGSLVGHEPPVRSLVIREGFLQSPGEFWQALGGKPKAALHYTLTLAVNVFPVEDIGPAVTEKVIKWKQGVP